MQALPFGAAQNRRLVMDGIRAVQEARGGLSIAGLLGLGWAALGMFGAVRWALNRAWGVRSRGIIKQRLVDVGTAFGLWLLVSLSVMGTAALHALRGLAPGAEWWSPVLEPLWGAAQWALPAVLTFIAFLMLYRYFPHANNTFRAVWPGALVGTLLFEAAKNGFAVYVGRLSRHELLFGTLESVIAVHALGLCLGDDPPVRRRSSGGAWAANEQMKKSESRVACRQGSDAKEAIGKANVRGGDTGSELAACGPRELRLTGSPDIPAARGTEPGAPQQSLGALKVDENLKGGINAITPLRDFDLYITAEPSQLGTSSTGKTLLYTRVIMK
jgi:YihY family inner membrane protein